MGESRFASALSWIPFGIALVVCVGNLYPQLPTWGFDFHILGIPFRGSGELGANLLMLAISLFPVVHHRPGIHHLAYLLVVIPVLAFLAFKFYQVLLLWLAYGAGSELETGSVFRPVEMKLLTITVLIGYLIGTLRLVSVKHLRLSR